MASIWLDKKWAAVPLLTLGLVACSGTSDITTQSVPAEQTKVAEPDCGSLKAEIDQLNAAKLPDKLQQAAAKKYSPTQDEWSSFPRYNKLIETYTVKKCEPSLQQAKAGPKAKPKTATVPQKTADAAASAAAPATAKVKKAAATAAAPAEQAAAPAQAPYQGVTLQIPKQE